MENTLPRPNLLAWFDIPVLDLDRAIHCYTNLFDAPLHKEKFGPEEMAIFTAGQGNVTGALVINPAHKPSTDGTLLYFNCNPSLKTVLDRAATQALKIALPSTQLPNNFGYIAIVEDTEGNRIGLHATAA
jgi:predicted enzyme related to lactoylglutathione lyase